MIDRDDDHCLRCDGRGWVWKPVCHLPENFWSLSDEEAAKPIEYKKARFVCMACYRR